MYVHHYHDMTNDGSVAVQGEAFTGPLRPDGACLLKMSHMQNATAVFTDFKGNNFAYLQCVYRFVNCTC